MPRILRTSPGKVEEIQEHEGPIVVLHLAVVLLVVVPVFWELQGRIHVHQKSNTLADIRV